VIGKRQKILLAPEDSEAFAKALAERKKARETERLVELVGAERRAKEDLQRRSEQSLRRAKDILARGKTTPEYRQKVHQRALDRIAAWKAPDYRRRGWPDPAKKKKD
jgi:hypothetical protein